MDAEPSSRIASDQDTKTENNGYKETYNANDKEVTIGD